MEVPKDPQLQAGSVGASLRDNYMEGKRERIDSYVHIGSFIVHCSLEMCYS